MLSGLLAGGMLADRHDRRKLLMAVQVPQATLAVLLMLNSLLGRPASGRCTWSRSGSGCCPG